MSEPESNDAWLGLLKWSLNYVDGTVPSSESSGFTQMTEEDRAFLEEVMKNGIIDEGQRMKTILSSLVSYLDNILAKDKTDVIHNHIGNNGGVSLCDDSKEPPSEDEASELLSELQDIIEQIDYAKSFAAMGGIKFLIGCSAQREKVPDSIRSGTLSCLSTLCQNNPPVQYMMLEQGSIVKLTEIYFAEFPQKNQDRGNENTEESNPLKLIDNSLRAKIIQAMSSSVRNHDTAETIFCMNDSSVKMIESGLGMHCKNEALPVPNLALRRKTLFFLQALVTSDSSDVERIHRFARAIQYVACNFLDPEMEPAQEMREMVLSMITRLLDRKVGVNSVLDITSSLIKLGVRRVSFMRTLEGEDEQYMQEELDLWESLITKIAKTTRDP